jgi:small subunit ribosomal protein S13
MVQIFSSHFSANANICVSLSQIQGISRKRAKEACRGTSISELALFSDLHPNQLKSLVDYIERNFTVDSDLRQLKSQNIKEIILIRAYRGDRHKSRLPVRGQRTKTNARTVRKKRTR